MKSLWVTASAAIISVGVLAGCGTTSAINNATTTTNYNNQTVSTPTNKSAVNSTTNSTNSTSSTANQNTNTTTTSISNAGNGNSANTSMLTLEDIQAADGSYPGINLILTHGNMLKAYTNPHIVTNGTVKHFVITLTNVNPGKYQVGNKINLDTSNIPSVKISKSGNNLVLTFDISNQYKSYNIGPSGGFEIGISFSRKG